MSRLNSSCETWGDICPKVLEIIHRTGIRTALYKKKCMQRNIVY